jgi:hypothetical protein
MMLSRISLAIIVASLSCCELSGQLWEAIKLPVLKERVILQELQGMDYGDRCGFH